MAAVCAVAMTEAFLQRFGPASLQELTASSLSDKAPAIEPSPLGDFELLGYIWNFAEIVAASRATSCELLRILIPSFTSILTAKSAGLSRRADLPKHHRTGGTPHCRAAQTRPPAANPPRLHSSQPRCRDCRPRSLPTHHRTGETLVPSVEQQLKMLSYNPFSPMIR